MHFLRSEKFQWRSEISLAFEYFHVLMSVHKYGSHPVHKCGYADEIALHNSDPSLSFEIFRTTQRSKTGS
jgi:hypothetical protein